MYQLFYTSLPWEDILQEDTWFSPLVDQNIEIMDPKLLEFPQESHAEKKEGWSLCQLEELVSLKRLHLVLTCHSTLQGRLEPRQ